MFSMSLENICKMLTRFITKQLLAALFILLFFGVFLTLGFLNITAASRVRSLIFQPENSQASGELKNDGFEFDIEKKEVMIVESKKSKRVLSRDLAKTINVHENKVQIDGQAKYCFRSGAKEECRVSVNHREQFADDTAKVNRISEHILRDNQNTSYLISSDRRLEDDQRVLAFEAHTSNMSNVSALIRMVNFKEGYSKGIYTEEMKSISKIFIATIFSGFLLGLIIFSVYLLLLSKLFHFRKTSLTDFLGKLIKQRKLGHLVGKYREIPLARVQPTRKLDSVAVIGISCRFGQGVNSKDDFWNMLVNGECVIGSYPKNRLEEKEMRRFYNPGRRAPGKHYTLKGAFLDKVSGFDAQFFGISPAECRALDPQQRLLLQVVYEAIEDAGLRLEDLQRCRTGIYVGLMNLDYGRLLLDNDNVPKIDEFASTGITASTAANRISFSLNLTGPSLTLDTACSSSLTALNIAIAHLQTSECDVAIVCAPNLILARYFHTACCRTGLLAEDGRCKSFDVKGDGYGRGEGVAAVVLKETSLTLLDRDDAYAEIVACGLNNDGQNAIPMTGPSDKMQAELARRVLQETGLKKEDVQYVETHGTGTAVGDVVEMRSVSDVYGNSPKRVLRIGSVKSNINHTESTAGLAGLIKVCLMIKHAYFVPTINVHELKPQLMIPERKMVVQVKHEPWNRDNEKPRTAAVCCYGYGGANAHAVVQEIIPLPGPVIRTQNRAARIMTLSARSRNALRMMAKRFSEWLEMEPDDDGLLKANICHTLNDRRSVHSHRLSVTFRSLKQAANLMNMFAEDEPGWQKFVAVGETTAPVKKLAFIYGGQGTRWHGMAKEMIEHEPKFRESIEEIDYVLKSLGVPWCLMEELTKSESTSRVTENPIGQTALFAVHHSMTYLLRSWGISPAAVIGHSLGEISAACAVNVITLKEALQLVLLRSQLHEGCSSTGRMVAVGMSAETATNVLEDLDLESRVSIAVVNSPVDVVLSGDAEAMEIVESHLQERYPDVFWKTLETTRAFHSAEMEEIKHTFMEGIDRIKLTTGRATIPFYSTVTGTQVSGQQLNRDHWWRNVRHPVLFSSAVKNMISDGYKLFIEINAAPQFPRYVHEISSHYQKKNTTQETDVSVITTLPKRTVTEQHMSFLHNCPATLFTRGYQLSWERIQGSGSKSFIRCPTYPWQEKEFWYRDAELPEHVKPLASATQSLDCDSSSHPLLGKSVATEAFSGLHVLESEIDVYSLPYLKDHAFQDFDHSVIPGAVYVEMGLALVLHMFPNVTPRVSGVTFNNLLTLSENDVLNFRTRLDVNRNPGKEHSYQITMVEGNGNEIVVSEGFTIFDATVVETKAVGLVISNLERIDAIKSRLVKQPLELFNSERIKRRFCYGPQFSLVTECWRGDTEALCAISLTEEIRTTLSSYVVHPSIIDACFQSLFLLKQSTEKPVPYRVGDVTVLQRNFTEMMFCHVKSSGDETMEQACDVLLMDCHGNLVILIKGFLMADLSNLRPDPVLRDVAFQMQWKQETEDPMRAMVDKSWLIVPDRFGFAEKFICLLPSNQSTMLIELADTPNKIDVPFSNALQEAMAKLESEDQRLCVVNFLPVENSSLKPDWKNFQHSHQLAFESSLVLLQAILKEDQFADRIQLVLVASGSASLVSDANEGVSATTDLRQLAFPWSSTLFGFRRTLAEELTAPKTTIVDLPQNPIASDFQQMATDLQGVEIPEEIVYRSGLRYLNRIKRLDVTPGKPTKKVSTIGPSGVPRALRLSFLAGRNYLRETTRSKPGVGYLEMEVSHASPLLQLYWTSPCDKVAVCGKLTRNGSHSFSEGDLVLAVCEASKVGNYVMVDERSLVKLGQELTAQEAAALGFPLALSLYIVRELISNCKGKKILVYAGQDEYVCVFACVAVSLGATVICVTKNSRYKSHLQQFGISVVVAEDELVIEREFEELDCHVACLLNRPRIHTLQQIVGRVQEGGRVVSISCDENEGFNVFVNRNITFVNTSVEKIVSDGKKFGALLASCTTLLASNGYLQKLENIRHKSRSIYDSFTQPESSFGSEQDSESGLVLHTFRLNSKDMPEEAEFLNLALDSSGLRDDRTYLVVGGVRGFGFEVARWMIENGAKTVMCTARSPPSDEKIAEVARLEQATGSRILLRQADVTSWEEMGLVVQELKGLPDVAGIVFSAMILEDQRIKNADLETCRRVVATKVQGSVVLHQLSLSMNLDFFVMFSSIAGVIGNIGQLAYSAANSFLDSLCEYRRHKLGLPALSVDWGTMGGAGILERSKEIANLFQNYGFRLMSCKKGMEFLKDFLCQHPDQAQVVLCDIDWSTYLRSSAYVLHRSPRLQPIKDEIPFLKKDGNFDTGLTLEDLKRQNPEQRRTTVEEFVRKLLSTWTEGGCNEVDLNLALYKYGVDSIGAANMSLQIRNAIGALFEIYYFIQPKTNGLLIINDALEQIENLSTEKRTEDGSENHQDSAAITDIVNEFPQSGSEVSEIELKDNHEKVVPLYIHDDAVVKVFMMHSSHKSALANAPFAAGFQHQDTVSLYSIGVDYVGFKDVDYGSVRSLAKRYIKLIKAEQSRGPYYLAGFSFGGTLSFEVASQLIEQDEEVAMVVMLDTFAWFPKSWIQTRHNFTNFQELLISDFKHLVPERFLKTLAIGRLGYTLEELQQLVDKLGTGEKLVSAIEERAEERNVTLENVRNQVASLKYQIEEASSAHFDWQPSQTHFQQALTYIRCRNPLQSQNASSLWSAADSWKSLTSEMDLFSLPVSHFDLLEQPYAQECGSLIMTTAAIRHRNHYTIQCQPSGPRSSPEKRLIEWIKQSVDISMYSAEVVSNGKLWLSEDETSLNFSSETCVLKRRIVINLTDIHNIVPGKYVDALCSTRFKNQSENLIISLLACGDNLYHFLCLDWQQRDKLIDALEILFATPILRFH